jgi:hypothetical protein
MSASLALLAFFVVAFVGPAWRVGSQPRPARPRHAAGSTLSQRHRLGEFPPSVPAGQGGGLAVDLADIYGLRLQPLSDPNREILRRRMRVEFAEARGREVVG